MKLILYKIGFNGFKLINLVMNEKNTNCIYHMIYLVIVNYTLFK